MIVITIHGMSAMIIFLLQMMEMKPLLLACEHESVKVEIGFQPVYLDSESQLLILRFSVSLHKGCPGYSYFDELIPILYGKMMILVVNMLSS